MSFNITPKWAADKNYLWHSNPENVPNCKTFFEKCVVRPKTSSAWKVLKKETDGNLEQARAIINKYAYDNANMLGGRTVQTMCDMVLIDRADQEEAIRHGASEFDSYKPCHFKLEKDTNQTAVVRDEYVSVFKSAIDGIKEAADYFGLNRLEGEKELMFNVPGLQLPYNGRPDFSKRIELKTKWSSYSDKTKSGKRSASLPTQPLFSHVAQVAGYWAGTARMPQAIVYANATGSRVFTPDNCDWLTQQSMETVAQRLFAKCKIRENLLKKSADVEELLSLIEPDFAHLYAWDVAPEVLLEAKQIWGMA